MNVINVSPGVAMSDTRYQGSTNSYAAILWSYVHGVVRLMNAELATHRLSNAVAKYRLQTQDGAMNHGDSATYLVYLEKVSYEEWDAFNYVTSVSHLVYATSLLDTFLNDSTRFLLLLFPGAIGKEIKVSTEELIHANRPSDIVASAVERKAREVSYGSFAQRLEFLEERFSLKIQLTDECLQELSHYSSVRNVAVHDQGFIALHVTDEGSVSFTQRTCALHPTTVNLSDLRNAYRTYAEVVRRVGSQIVDQVLKSPADDALRSALDSLFRQTAGISGETTDKKDHL